MTADIIPIGLGYGLLRSPLVEMDRQRRIQVRRVAAFGRAVHGGYHAADQAMFGSVDRILREGPGEDPRLGRGPPSAA